MKEPRRLLSSTALAACLLLMTLLYATYFASIDILFEPWKHPTTDWRGNSSREKVDKGSDSQRSWLRRLVRGDDRARLEAEGFSCHNGLHADVCVANKPVRIDTKAMKIYIPSDSNKSLERIVKPYARKEDDMQNVTPVKMLKGNINPPACDFTHNVTAVIFSSGGFAGNLFHEFNEIIIPLFITCRHFQSRLKFIITDYSAQWVQKYNPILTQISPYAAIDPEADGKVHCFPGAIVGLQFHDNLVLNSTDIPGGYSMTDFKHFLMETYNLKIRHVSEVEKPVLMLISRQNSRRFLNEDEMVKLMEKLGFQVLVIPPGRMSKLKKFARVVNSCSVLVGAHGAGMANELFLPTGAVVIQAVPLGLEWASTAYFGEPAGGMGLRYLEYKIEPEESSLINTYGRDHPVITDVGSIIAKGYQAFRAVYVDGQDLKINLTRFRETLIEAMQILGLSAP
ncbi:hypothetical protein SLE2022_018660 [Rubroshorea leprosula]